jgi:hypothetical protein
MLSSQRMCGGPRVTRSARVDASEVTLLHVLRFERAVKPSCVAHRLRFDVATRRAPSQMTRVSSARMTSAITRRAAIKRRVVMKRFALTLLSFAAIGLAACQGHSPTAPGESPAFGPADGVLNEGSGSSFSVRISASPSRISAGQSSTLTWTSAGATAVYLDGVAVSRSGSKSVSPRATTTYTLLGVNGSRRTSSTATVTVREADDDEHGGGDDDHTGTTLTATLTALPTTIQSGQSSLLTWITSNATSVYLDGVAVDPNGTKTVSPTATKTYNLVAMSGSNRVRSSATVTVSGTAPPPVVMPTATLDPPIATIQSGQSVTLTWNTTDATSATINGNPVPLDGSQAYSPTVTTTYELVATNAAGSDVATSIVTVTTSAPPPPPPSPPTPMPTALLTAMATSIQSGQSTTLQWATSNATSVTLDGAPVNANGSRVVSPTATTTYVLVASNSAGSVQSSATVTVTAPPPPPPPTPMPTALLTAMPTSIQSGQSATLQWATSNATSVTLDGAPVNANGSRVVSPTATTTYVLVASNSAGSVQSSATVTVAAPPPPPPPPPPAGLTWVNDIQPITSTHCTMCHSGPSPTAGFDLSTYAGTMTRVTPGDPNSRLIQMTQTGGAMHGFLIDSTDPTGNTHAQTIYDWIVTFGAPQQ